MSHTVLLLLRRGLVNPNLYHLVNEFFVAKRLGCSGYVPPIGMRPNFIPTFIATYKIVNLIEVFTDLVGHLPSDERTNP
jgi:hypothetical protein